MRRSSVSPPPVSCPLLTSHFSLLTAHRPRPTSFSRIKRTLTPLDWAHRWLRPNADAGRRFPVFIERTLSVCGRDRRARPTHWQRVDLIRRPRRAEDALDSAPDRVTGAGFRRPRFGDAATLRTASAPRSAGDTRRRRTADSRRGRPEHRSESHGRKRVLPACAAGGHRPRGQHHTDTAEPRTDGPDCHDLIPCLWMVACPTSLESTQ